MQPKTFMLIAGEASGDLLAAELVAALRAQLPSATFFGAGGPRMASAKVDLALNMTQHAVVGLTDVLKNYFKFKRLFEQLLALAIERQPDAVIGVDFGGFNLRFGAAVKAWVRKNPESGWNPKIIQYISPQVWASRPGRAKKLEADYDLLLSIFPFEKVWYSQRAPKLPVEFVGHPMLDRASPPPVTGPTATGPLVLLLPGSRKSELLRHLPVMFSAWTRIQAALPDSHALMVLPNESLVELARSLGTPDTVKIQTGNLPAALTAATVAIASTGTVTMECAFYGVPTVTLYKTSWLTYEIARRIVTVKSLTMPNLLAGEEVMPEFIQHEAIGYNIAQATVKLLQSEPRRAKIKKRLTQIVSTLGKPGASRRAAAAILELFA